MAAPVLQFPVPRRISKRQLRESAEVRKNLNEAWKNLFRHERMLRERERQLTELEAQCEATENQIREALAAGAEIVE